MIGEMGEGVGGGWWGVGGRGVRQRVRATHIFTIYTSD